MGLEIGKINRFFSISSIKNRVGVFGFRVKSGYILFFVFSVYVVSRGWLDIGFFFFRGINF